MIRAMRFLVLALFCGLVSPALAEDDYGPMPKLPGDLCERHKSNEVCCPYVVVDENDDLYYPLPLHGKVHWVVKEGWRRNHLDLKRFIERPCKGRA